jgi:osmotically-inducible protein OsmY
VDSDTQVCKDILAELKAIPALREAQLNLHVHDGVVTIGGRLNSFAERKAVERAAHRVAGIRTLILELHAAALPGMVTGKFITTLKDTESKNFG